MSHVVTEILGLLAAAAALGVVLGWAIFGGRRRAVDAATSQLRTEKVKLEADLKTQGEARKAADLRVAEADARVAVFQGRFQHSETRVAEAARHVAEVTQHLEELRAKLKSASSSDEVESRDQRIAALEAQLRLRDSEVARLAGGGQMAAAAEAELKTQIGDRERTIERLRGELEALRARSSPDAPKVADLQAEIVELRATLVATAGVAPATDIEKDQTIARLTEEVTGLRAAYDAAEQALEEQDAAIDKLTRDIVQSQQKLTQAEARAGVSRPLTPSVPLPLGALLTPVTPLPGPPASRPSAAPAPRPATMPAMPAVDVPPPFLHGLPGDGPAVTGAGGFVRRPTTPTMPSMGGPRSVEADPAPAFEPSPPAVRRPISTVLGMAAPGFPSLAKSAERLPATNSRPETGPQQASPASPPPVRRPSTSSMPAVMAPRPSFDAAPYAASALPPFRPTRALGPPEDLKRIRGIGPATEKRLNEVGVSTWAQVAAFAPAEIPTIADIAKVSIDKIRPWIDQAKALVAQSTDE